MIDIFNLYIKSNKYVSLASPDLALRGVLQSVSPLAQHWQVPPFELDNKSKKLADIISWCLGVVLVSARCKEVLAPLLGQHVEFLPFAPIKNKPYWLMHVLTTVQGIIDMDKSDIGYYLDTLIINDIGAVTFKTPLPSDLPPIFKLGEHPRDIFVGKAFAELAIEHKLSGFDLGDPGVFSGYLMVRGLKINVVEGIVG